MTVPIPRGIVTAPKIEGVNARERVATKATTQFSRDMVQNPETIADRAIFSSQKYQQEMNQAIDKQAGAQIAGVNAGTGQAIAVINAAPVRRVSASNKIIS